MTAGPDMASDRAPLTAEERALAQRLARLGPHGEPSPALDTRILAAAHAAASSGARPRLQRQRWPLAVGVAASLALAVGVAWRLRPLPEPAPAYRSQTVSATKAMPARAADAADAGAPEVAAVAAAESAAAAAAAPAAAPPAATRETRIEPLPQPDAFPHAARPSPSAPALPEEPPIVSDAPAPAAPALAAPPVSATSSAAGAGSPSRNAQPEKVAAEASDMAQRASQSRASSADIPADAMAEEDVPPATADAPEVRDAWLQRIRELAATGKLDDARASLREFIRRYPDYLLPDDVRALNP